MQEYKAFKDVGKAWGFVLWFFVLPPKAEENISELLGSFILGEENENDIYQLTVYLLGRKEKEKVVGGIMGRCVYMWKSISEIIYFW